LAGDIRLVDPSASEPAFQHGAVSSFVVGCANVGPPARVKVWHDNSGPHPDWHLQELRVRRKVGPAAHPPPCTISHIKPARALDFCGAGARRRPPAAPLQGDAQWTFFPCDQWLSTSQGDGRICRVLLPGAAFQRRSYAITTATSDLRGGGSSANVWVVLHGSLATTSRHVLSGGASDFERGAVNHFVLEDKDIGQLLQV
jgi:hypothetical protein